MKALPEGWMRWIDREKELRKGLWFEEDGEDYEQMFLISQNEEVILCTKTEEKINAGQGSLR